MDRRLDRRRWTILRHRSRFLPPRCGSAGFHDGDFSSSILFISTLAGGCRSLCFFLRLGFDFIVLKFVCESLL